MAATKIFPITVTEAQALAYIADPEKTDNGRLIFTSGCSDDPYQASRDFEEVRRNGTGLNTVLSQHFIQSFAPGEITPERALELGKELCDKFLKNEYQYFLAVHTVDIFPPFSTLKEDKPESASGYEIHDDGADSPMVIVEVTGRTDTASEGGFSAEGSNTTTGVTSDSEGDSEHNGASSLAVIAGIAAVAGIGGAG